MKQYKRLTTKCEVGIGLTETDGNIVNDYEKVVNRLAKLEDKIEDKMLMEMPCKIGGHYLLCKLLYFSSENRRIYSDWN